MDLAEVQGLLGSHSRVLLDTELLLVLVVGSYSVDRVGRARNFTKSYAKEDFVFLSDVLQAPRSLVVTPFVLTEVDNFLKKSGARDDPDRRGYRAELARIVSDPVQTDEQSLLSTEIVGDGAFLWLGYPDVSTVRMAGMARCLVISADRDLVSAAASRGFPCFNYRNVQPQIWAHYGRRS